jgi:hypothetical protein
MSGSPWLAALQPIYTEVNQLEFLRKVGRCWSLVDPGLNPG